jgi:hypothetical protein
MNNVCIRQCESAENGYGVFSSVERDISGSEVLISVPFRLCISVDAVINSELACIFQDDDFAGKSEKFYLDVCIRINPFFI